jgi:cellulose synthase operon protein C
MRMLCAVLPVFAWSLAALAQPAPGAEPASAAVSAEPVAEPTAEAAAEPTAEAAAKAEAPKAAPRPPTAEQVAKRDFAETVKRFQKVSDDFNQEILATIRRARDARVRRIELDFEKRINEIETVERERRLAAVAAFERFIKSYPDDAKYTPMAMFRLAELYYEDSKYAYEAADAEHDILTEKFRTKEITKEPEAPMLNLDRTIDLYAQIMNRFPSFKRLDGVQYLWAYCQDEMGNFQAGMEGFGRVVSQYPDSEFVAESWLRIGETHFTEDRLCEALDAYHHVLADKESAWYDKALYKVAWSHYRLDRFSPAVDRFIGLLDYADKKTAETGESGTLLRKEAIQYVAIAAIEPGWGRPPTGEEKAGCLAVIAGDEEWDNQLSDEADRLEELGQTKPETPPLVRLGAIFEKAGDRPYKREIYEEVAKILFEQAAWDKYVDVARALIDIDPMHPDSPQVTMKIITALDQQGRDRLAEGAAEREKLFTLFGPGTAWQEANKNRPSVIRKAMKQAQEALIASALFRLQLAQRFLEEDKLALATEEASEAAKMLADYIERYPYDPKLYEYRYFLGIALDTSAQFLLAANAYEGVRDDKKHDKYREDSAYRSFLALQNEVDSQREKGLLPEPPEASDDPQPIPELLVRKIKASMRYIETNPSTKDTPTFYFNAATTYAAYSHNKKADHWYRMLIDKFPLDADAKVAARWVLNSYSSTQSWVEVEAWCRRMLKEGVGQDDPEFVAQMAKVAAGAVYKQALAAHEKKEFLLAHKHYIRLVEEDPKNPYAARALFSAASVMGDLKRFITAGKLYERVFTEYPEEKELAGNALFKVAETAFEGFQFDRAIRLYERLVNKYKKSKDRADALYNLAYAYQATEQYPRAAKSYELYARMFKDRDDAAEVFFRSAEVWEKAGDMKRMNRSFDTFIRKYGSDSKQGGRVVQIYAKLNDIHWDRLETELLKEPKSRRQRRAWVRRVAALRKKANSYGDKTIAEYTRRGFAPQSIESNYAAKAHFRKLETDFKRYLALDFDVGGRGSKKIKNLLKRVADKQALGKELSSKYLDLYAYQQRLWTSAATYRIGTIPETFAEQLYEAPPPVELRGNEDGLEGWESQMGELGEPYQDTATKQFAAMVNASRCQGPVPVPDGGEAPKCETFQNKWTKLALQSLNRTAKSDWPIEKDAITLTVDALLPASSLDMPTALRRKLNPAPSSKPEVSAASGDAEGKPADKSSDDATPGSGPDAERPEEKSEGKDEEKAEGASGDGAPEGATLPSPDAVAPVEVTPSDVPEGPERSAVDGDDAAGASTAEAGSDDAEDDK